ncbi:unnamed protein product [Lepidochelys kempii]
MQTACQLLKPQHFTLTHPRIPCSCWISREEASSSPLPSLAGSEALLPPHSFIDLKSVVAPVETSFLFAGLGRLPHGMPAGPSGHLLPNQSHLPLIYQPEMLPHLLNQVKLSCTCAGTGILYRLHLKAPAILRQSIYICDILQSSLSAKSCKWDTDPQN